jgi:glycosidase
MGDPDSSNVADQRADPNSVLNFVREMIAVRRATPDLQVGDSVNVPAPDGCWAWRRGASVTIVLNMKDTDTQVEGLVGRIVACTDQSRNGESVDKILTLAGWTGAVVAAS